MKNKKEIINNYLSTSIILTIFVLLLNIVTDFLYRDEVKFLHDGNKAGIFFIFTLITLIVFVLQVKNIFTKKEKRIAQLFLLLITLYVLCSQFFATISVNFL